MSYTTEDIIDIICQERIKPKSNIKFPCGICNKSVKSNQKAVQCDSCDLWIHIVCNNTTNPEYELLKHQDDLWFCSLCIIKKNLLNVPFTRCDNTELLNINTCNTMSFLEALPSIEVVNETTNFSQISNDIDVELPNNTNSKYFSINEFHKLYKPKNLNIFHTNINGLETKLENLHEFVTGTPHKLDILSITETSEKESVGFLTNTDIDGYIKFHTPSRTSKGGTAIYVNENFNAIERSDLSIMTDEFESTWIEIKNVKSKNIICGSLYRHPHNNFKEFFQYLEKSLSSLVKENKEIFLTGDFNFDLLKIDTDINTQHFYNLMCSYGFLPHIIHPTRVTQYTATVIDNIFSNNLESEIISGNIHLTLSDHFAQFVSVNRGLIDYKSLNIYKRDYSKFSTSSFRDDVEIQNWNFSYNNVHDSFKDFYNKIDGAVNRHAPLKKLTPKEIKLQNKPWLTPDILKMIKNRNKAFERKKRQPNNENCKRVYNELRNSVNREIKRSKKLYYANYFEENINNIKKTWQGIRKIVNLNKYSSKTSQLNIGGKIIDDNHELATNFNKFFVNVEPNTEKTIPNVPNISPSKYLKNRNQINFVIAHISNEEILDIINALDNKSSGPYSIPLKLLAMIPDLIITPLAHIINMSFLTGEFPDLLKIVKVIPIHKGGSTQDINNFRPISLLSIFDKIMEKIMHKNLYSYLESHNILYKNQFGFRKNNSTVYALAQITETQSILENLDAASSSI